MLHPLLAHLRQQGKLIVYPSSIRPLPSFCQPFSKISNQSQFHVVPPWEGRLKVCINGPCHMFKMTAMPIYGPHHGKTGRQGFQPGPTTTSEDVCRLEILPI